MAILPFPDTLKQLEPMAHEIAAAVALLDGAADADARLRYEHLLEVAGANFALLHQAIQQGIKSRLEANGVEGYSPWGLVDFSRPLNFAPPVAPKAGG